MSTAGDTVVARTVGSIPDSGTHQLAEVWRVGDAEGIDSTITFGQINAFAVRSDTVVAVFDPSGPTLRLYDADGKYLRNLGRKGAGPGEYSQANGMAFLPDGRLAFWDPPTSRITVYDPENGTTDTWIPPVTGMWMNNALTPAASHAFALEAPLRDTSDGEAGPRRSAYFLYDTSGEATDTIVIPPDGLDSPRLVAQSSTMMSVYSIPFMPDGAATLLADGRLVTGTTDRYVLTVHGGSTPRRIEREAVAVPVESGHADEMRLQTEASMRSVDPEWSWTGPGIPSVKPLYLGLQGMADGRLWVRVSAPSERIPEAERAEPRPVAPNAPPPPPVSTWREPAWYDVFEPDGTFLARLVLPARATLLGARGDLVWGVTRDELDVPYLTQWRITPSLGATPRVP
jgi:hypothetical protein